jgi:hypothetical protein
MSPNIVRVLTSREMRWTGHVVRVGEIRNANKSLVRKPEGKSPVFGSLWQKRKDNIKTELKKKRTRLWTGFTCHKVNPFVGSCEHYNELPAFIKGGHFLYQLSDCHFLKKGCDPEVSSFYEIIIKIIELLPNVKDA